ncbi:MAG: FAD-dependent oxidoreductase [Candidatus Micrarchaeota archaeon]
MTNYILGAGIAGLSSAYFSNTQQNIILERLDRYGGRIRSLDFDTGFVETGAQFFSEEDVNVIPLIKQLNLENKLNRMKLNEFSVFHNGKFAQIKNKKTDQISEREQNAITKFCASLSQLEPSYFFDAPPKELIETDFEKWYKQNIGEDAFWLIDGMAKAITFCKPKEISAIFGLFACSVFFSKCYTLKGGLQTLCTQMLEMSKPDLQLGTEVKKIFFDNEKATAIQLNQNGNDKEIEIKKNDSLISAITADELGKIASDNKISAALKGIDYHGCTFVIIKTKNKLLGNGAGMLFPDGEHGVSIIVNEPYYFNFPTKGGIIGILTTYKNKKEKNLEEAISFAEQIVPNLSKQIENKQIVEWDFGMPVYNEKLVRAQQKLSKTNYKNFAICGDFMHLPSLDGAIQSAKEAIKQINLADLHL